MTRLKTEPNFHRRGAHAASDSSAADAFYALLIDAHRGLSDEQSELTNARLVLLLANHVGDLDVLREALAAARQETAE
jgi:predicted LPLAT superfamily acyltransferase